MSSVIIRSMNVADISVVFQMGINELDMKKIYHQNWTLTGLATYFEKERNLCIVAESNDCVVGFALGRKTYSGWSDNLGYLEWIVVAGEHQKKGIGHALCNEMIKRFKTLGINRIIADVKTQQSSSANLLKKFSFKRLFSVDWYIKEI